MPALLALHAAADVALIVTQPDRPSGRGQRLTPTPVKAAALAADLPVREPERLRDVASELETERADVFAVVSYGKIVPQWVLSMPPLGAFNVHPSLLPLYRGATPLQSAIRDGRRETGVSVILMDAGMDTGDLVQQRRTPLGERETYGELHDRLAPLGAELLWESVAAAVAGTLVRTPQASSGVTQAEITATATHPLQTADLFVDWAWPAKRIIDLVRSLAPAPLARAALGPSGETVKLGAVVAAPGVRALGAPGTLLFNDDTAFVVCGDGAVALERVTPPNRREMTGAAFARPLAVPVNS